MRVLLVDDEPRVLEALSRMLFALAPAWEIVSRANGHAALELLSREQVDVVITDMMMPGMGGAELLEQTQVRFPSVVRIILSGQTDIATSMHSMKVAHQYLDKPCSPQRLVGSVDRLQTLRMELEDPCLLEMVGKVGSLPSAPTIYLEISKELAGPEPDIQRMVSLIEQDPSMSAKLLHLVNSSFFGRSGNVSSVEVAIQRLGLRNVRDLTLVAEAFRLPTLVSPSWVDAIQSRALQASRLARRMTSGANAELASTAALLADVGHLILPDEAVDPRALTHDPTLHAHLGGYLLALWSLPPVLVEAVARHHEPEKGGETYLGPVSATYLAHALVAGEEISPAFVERHGIAGQLEQWRGWVSSGGAG